MPGYHVNSRVIRRTARRVDSVLVAHRAVGGRIAAAVALAVVALSRPIDAGARIRVRSPLQVEATLVSGERLLTLRLSVRDDQGAVVAGQAVQGELFRADGSIVTAHEATSCAPDKRARVQPATPAPRSADASPVLGATDSAGELCLQIEPGGDLAAVEHLHLSVPGGDLFLGTTLDVKALRNDLPDFHFDRADVPLFVDEENAISATESNRGGGARQLDQVVLEGESRGTDDGRRGQGLASWEELGRTTLDEGGRCRFVLSAGVLGAPGLRRLRVTRASGRASDDGGRAALFRTLEHASIAFAEPPKFVRQDERGSLASLVDVTVHSHHGVPISSGTIVAQIGERPIAAARVGEGHAKLPIDLPWSDGSPTDAEQGARLSFHYEATTPWLIPDAPIAVDVAPTGIAPSDVAWPVLGAIVAVIALLGRFLQTTAARQRSRTVVPLGPPVAKIDYVAGPAKGATWAGEVRDAHDGAPLSEVEVSISRGGFTQTEVLARAKTDVHGVFALEVADVTPGLRMLLVHRGYDPLTRAAPPAGQLRIAMVSRRRSVLAKFAAWARARPGHDDGRGVEPTPLQVALDAADGSEEAEWAAEVHNVAFGPAQVEETAVHRLEALAPKGRPMPRRL